jgi:uncharacterized protein YeaO (DUF488 family)
MPFQVRRVREQRGADDGFRVLVDRLWPRGLSKQAADLDQWQKELGPSHELRRWFDHDPARWEEFQRRFSLELDEQGGEALAELLERGRNGRVTLLFGSREERFNNAVALARYLEARS